MVQPNEIRLLALRGLIGDRRAVTALEYGLIAAVMGALIVTAFTTLGTKMEPPTPQSVRLMTSKASSM